MATERHSEPWQILEEIVRAKDADRLRVFLGSFPSGETARAVSRLDEDNQRQVLTLLPPQQAADLIVELSEDQAAELLRELSPDQAAPILDALPSDEQADLLALFSRELAQAVLERMAPQEAEDVRQLSRYPLDTAGGIMVTEFLAYPQIARVADVVADLRRHADEYSRYDLQYVYVTDAEKRLVGVLRLRDLLLAPEDGLLPSIMVAEPHGVRTDTGLDELRSFFDRHAFFGAPVTDGDDRLVGAVLRADVEEALSERTDRAFLRFSGIVGGEEFRTMPLGRRVSRRLAWLGISILLNLLAASIVGLYQDTLAAVIALAVFLPVISGLGGSSGNQALAVSLRELALGLIKPYELWWVVAREASVGILNGLALGLVLGCVAFLWKGNPYLGLVVGGALALTTVVAVCLGGGIPLLLKRLRLDPALASGPIIMTLTDMCGFFFALSFASVLLPQLGGLGARAQ
jgi:magnesium transporter